LVIDPEVLVYVGFIGGDGEDHVDAIAADRDGNVYVAGSTFSTESTFPVTGGPDVTATAGGFGDAFVAKVAPDGSTLSLLRIYRRG
jgi:hypothetical protein